MNTASLDAMIEPLLDLIPVLAGALIALAGGAIKYFVDRQDRTKQVRREKLEELLDLAFELKPWTDKIDDRYQFGKTTERVPSPLERIEVLGNLYFPELGDHVDAVVTAANTYKLAALKSARKRLAAAKGADEANAADPADANHEAPEEGPYRSLVAAIDGLAAAAAAIAKKLV